ncbi:MAG: DNA-binding protein [Deltaproteobacteria bacterium]|nr:DNA-binding protein [Deltaproteobacteria bacterium]
MLTNTILAFSLSMFVCPSPSATAQCYRAGWGPVSTYGRMYDPRTVETVAGEIAKVERVAPLRGMHRGVHLVLKLERGESLAVHLGPEWYVDRQDITFEPGDKVEVRGSRVTFEGKPVIIAAEVKKDGQTLHLRDANGVPAWTGWRRRGR